MSAASAARVHSSADVDASVFLGSGTTVWHLAQVREGAVLGENCVVSRGAYIGAGVHLGAACKLQNYALVYEPAHLAEGVFIGPGAVLTNDEFPRAVHADGTPRDATQWHPVGVTLERGASVGARAVCVAPVRIGPWAMVGAGAVVTTDVPGYALVLGVPARQVGWVGEAGVRLHPAGAGQWRCPSSGARYVELGDTVARQGEPDRDSREGRGDA